MNDDLKSLFEREGRQVTAPSNSPLIASDASSVYMVSAGGADLYFAPLENGTAAGSRRHVVRLEYGALIFGIEASPRGQMLLVTDTEGGELRELPRTGSFASLLSAEEFRRELVQSVDRWVEGLFVAVLPPVPPKTQTLLQAAGSLRLKPEEAARPAQVTLWVSCGTKAGGAYVSVEDFEVGCDFPLPVPAGAWIAARTEVELNAFPTGELLAKDPGLNALDRFHQLYLRYLREEWDRTLTEEHARLEQKASSFRSMFLRAGAELAGLLDRTTFGQSVPMVHPDPLFAACALVGRSLGVEMQTYRQLKSGQAPRDPLEAIASASRVRYRRVTLRGKWWKQDNGPLLGALASDGRPVALLPVSRVRYEMIDPRDGKRVPVSEDVAKRLKPDCAAFYRPFPPVALSSWDVLSFSAKGLGRDLWSVALMGAVVGLLGILPAIVTGVLFDSIIPSGEQRQLLDVVAILIVGALVAGAFQFSQRISLVRIEGRLDGSLQAAVWDRLLSLPVPFFRRFSAGDLATRSLAISMIRQLLTGSTLTVTLLTIFSVSNLALLFYYDSRLGVWATVILAITLAVMMAAAYAALRPQRAAQELRQRIAGRVLQFLTGIAKIRVSGSEPAAFSVWAREFAAQRRLDYQATNINNWFAGFSSALPVLALVVIYWEVGGRLGTGDIQTGVFLAFSAAFTAILTVVSAMSTVLLNVLNAVPIYENAKPILETPPEVDIGKAVPGELSGEIEVTNIHFRYSPDAPLALNGVSFQAHPGEFIAFVGPSGSGKSTLFRLLLGFEKPESGSILFDRQDLSGLDLVAVRRQIGVVLQNGKLVPGDIFRNIAGTSSQHTVEDAWEAARMAGLDEDIRRMPMGMSTMIIEQGGAFSGGQRQRLLIARALINRPRILLMDEATSALDNRTQAIVSESLKQLQGTRIVIAHRLSTVVQADRLYVVKDGVVIEDGTYQELMDKKGEFYVLAQRQLA